MVRGWETFVCAAEVETKGWARTFLGTKEFMIRLQDDPKKVSRAVTSMAPNADERKPRFHRRKVTVSKPFRVR